VDSRVSKRVTKVLKNTIFEGKFGKRVCCGWKGENDFWVKRVLRKELKYGKHFSNYSRFF